MAAANGRRAGTQRHAGSPGSARPQASTNWAAPAANSVALMSMPGGLVLQQTGRSVVVTFRQQAARRGWLAPAVLASQTEASTGFLSFWRSLLCTLEADAYQHGSHSPVSERLAAVEICAGQSMRRSPVKQTLNRSVV